MKKQGFNRPLTTQVDHDELRHVPTQSSEFATRLILKQPTSWKEGFKNYALRSGWSDWCWDQLDGTRKDRVVRNFEHLVPGSHATGFLGQEVILFHMQETINKHRQVPLPPIKSRHTSEVTDSRLQVLMNVVEDWRPHHIHYDVKSRLPDDVQKELEKLMPGKNDSDEERAAKFKSMEMILDDFYENRSQDADSAPCLLHVSQQERCKLWSVEDDEDEDAHVTKMPLDLLGIGMPCDDVTRMGAKKGKLGKTRLSHLCFNADAANQKPAVVVTECGEDWTPDELAQKMHDTHDCEYFRLESKIAGDSYHRVRTVAHLWDRDKVISF